MNAYLYLPRHAREQHDLVTSWTEKENASSSTWSSRLAPITRRRGYERRLARGRRCHARYQTLTTLVVITTQTDSPSSPGCSTPTDQAKELLQGYAGTETRVRSSASVSHFNSSPIHHLYRDKTRERGTSRCPLSPS